MTYDELIERLDPAVYASLKRAVELGKWPDGRRISDEQKAICLEAVIYYENRHDIPEQERVGYIEPKKRADSKTGRDDDTSPVRILN
ncbi:YeaC family protein [Marinobacter salicampi]|uniref:YeaC family protein n=1 Tax=Marinobacter salicampi TaxID=435907 RepID=UPI0014075473|nr:DUF1315 family protein [Marinobacter salicampi]